MSRFTYAPRKRGPTLSSVAWEFLACVGLVGCTLFMLGFW